jgi:hypothetical protein
MIKLWSLIGAVMISAIWFKISGLNGEITTLNREIEKLTITNVILQQNNSALSGNIKLFSEADSVNRATISALQKERSESFIAIERLASAKRQDVKQLDAVVNKIEASRIDPTTDGPIAPVLKEAIREVQHLRKSQ